MENIDLIHLLIERVDERLNRPKGTSLPLIKFIKDRLGHDFRYAIDASKVKNELGWKTATSFDEGIVKTVAFYLKN
jgi:dTDP-glucose 4,6-dehydratase